MNRKYIIAYMSTMLVLFITIGAFAQSTKTKTITIVNGDTTITESNVDKPARPTGGKDVAKMEKEIEIMINDDGKGEKRIVKKIIINDDKKDGEALAYAYTIGDEGEDVEITTGEDGKEMKVVVKSGDGKDSKEKNVIKKEIKCEGPAKEKVTLNMNISVDKTTAKVEIESSSKEQMNVSILDENGKQVFYDSQKVGGKYSKEIPLGKKGTYFFNFIQNKTSKTEKIIVE